MLGCLVMIDRTTPDLLAEDSREVAELRLNFPARRDVFQNVADASRCSYRDGVPTVELGIVEIELGEIEQLVEQIAHSRFFVRRTNGTWGTALGLLARHGSEDHRHFRQRNQLRRAFA